ncbi:MAG: hypothetical protein NWS47_03430 [Alphaproteobacteria bacterium]|nr:hypothetical protein [Alphaproteobacteria bacterium]
MSIQFYLRLAVATFFVVTSCFADGVKVIGDEYNARLGAFNADPLNVSTYEPHTVKINGILKEKRNVDVNRHASYMEKETILKAVMASVVIHGEDSTYRLPAHGLKESDSLYRHFEILRLTEELTGIYWAQFMSAGNIRIGELVDSNLYAYSGLNWDVYSDWFKDVINEHSSGLAISHSPDLVIKKTEGFLEDVKSFVPQKVDELNEMIEFGAIEKRSITKQSVVFVSTYNLNYQPITNGLFIHLPSKDGREKYIVIENPFFDFIDEDSRSPYTIRAHALINGDAQPRDVSVGISITNGENGESEVGITNLQGGSVNSHDGTFSPNNMWLTNLPDRPLKAGEVFSFVSKIDGDGKAIDTLHILAYDANSVVNLARGSSNFGDFLERLNRVHEIFGTDTLSHLVKMMAFIEGRI